MKKNYVLIDYENVQPDYMAALESEHFSVIVFVGATQTKVSFEVASVLQQMGSRAEYIKISGNGSNALDFHIAFYIGQIAVKEPDSYFHIVSKDTGFDPLILSYSLSKCAYLNRSDFERVPVMSRIDSIFERVKKIYVSSSVSSLVESEIPDFVELSTWMAMTNSYLRAAKILYTDFPISWDPFVQLVGHAIELSIKTYLFAWGEHIPHNHDIKILCKGASKLGFYFEDRELAMLFHLFHFYYSDLRTGAKYKCRYPEPSEGSSGSIGSYADYESIILRFLAESELKLEQKQELFSAKINGSN